MKVMISAGEASGDKHAGHLIDALRARAPEREFEFFGAGSDEMRSRGADIIVDARDFAIIGLTDAIKGLPRLYLAFRRLIAAALERRPDVLVLVDWPEFNLKLARKLHKAGIRTVFYISPQVWAWRKYRVKHIRRDVDRMLVIFPFEVDFYREHDVEVEYVGHPLARGIAPPTTRDEFFAHHGLDPLRPLVALLPGSRKKEIAFNLPPLAGAVALLDRTRPEIQYVLPVASTVGRERIEETLGAARDRVRLVEHDMYSAVGHADFAVVASGTATLETGVLGTPLAVVYRASLTNYVLLRPLIRVDTFGMVNLIVGRRIANELIQGDFTPGRVAAEVLSFLDDPERRELMRADLAEVRERLAISHDASDRVAAAVLDVATATTSVG